MSTNSIRCPKCGTSIPIDDKVIIQRVRDQIQKDEEAKAEEKMKAHQIQFISDYKKRLEEEQSLNLKKIQTELAIKNKQIDEANERELKQIKLKTELEEKIKRQEIEIIKRVNEEKKLIEEKVRQEEHEKQDFKNLELQKQLNDTKKALAEAQRKAQQGSMQTQGEVLELSLEELLKKNFPEDKISAVPKGISGADIIQDVIHPSGQSAGKIVWESKRTKNWTEDWVQKLKDDGRQVKANIMVLVSEILPKDINHFGLYHGIWVTNQLSIIGLTTALRDQILSVYNTVSVNTGKEEKMEILYNHLCSPAFAQKVETIVETFITMQRSLEKEKIALNRIWTVREMHIKRLQDSTIKMYGEIQGIAGKSLPDIKLLELEEIGEKEKPDSQSNLFSD